MSVSFAYGYGEPLHNNLLSNGHFLQGRLFGGISFSTTSPKEVVTIKKNSFWNFDITSSFTSYLKRKIFRHISATIINCNEMTFVRIGFIDFSIIYTSMKIIDSYSNGMTCVARPTEQMKQKSLLRIKGSTRRTNV